MSTKERPYWRYSNRIGCTASAVKQCQGTCEQSEYQRASIEPTNGIHTLPTWSTLNVFDVYCEQAVLHCRCYALFQYERWSQQVPVLLLSSIQDAKQRLLYYLNELSD